MMPLYTVDMVVEADTPADAILGFLYPDGEPTSISVHSIFVTEAGV